MSEEGRRTRLFTPLEKLLRSIIGDFGGTYATQYVESDAQGKIRANRMFSNHLYDVITASGAIDESGSVYKDALLWLMHNGGDPTFDPQRWAHAVITGQISNFK